MKKDGYNKSKQSTPNMDAQALVQDLRIFIWKMIAKNNAETLVDPLLEPIKEPMPYVQGIQPAVDDVAEIKPTLDEIMPLPDGKKSAEQAQETKKPKKTSAKDLLADDDQQQISIEEAIKKTDTVATSPAQDVKPPTQPEQTTPPAKVEQTTQEQADDKEPAQPTILERYLSWKKERANRKDYFKALELQIKNKNSGLKAILDYLDSLCEE